MILAAALALALGACGAGGAQTAPAPTKRAVQAATTTAPTTTAPVTASYTMIEQALTGPGGLAICGAPEPDKGNLSGSYESQDYELVVGSCPTDSLASDRGAKTTLLSIDFYNSPGVRNRTLPTSFGERLIAWGVGPNALVTLYLSARPEIISGVEKAMTSLGATKGYDGR